MGVTGWIVLAIVVVVILAVLAFVFVNRRASARRARAEKIRQEATERAAELDRKEAEANAMAAQAQDARTEADRLESVSAEQRQRTAEARTDVDDALRKADRIDPNVRNRGGDSTGRRRATDEAPYDDDVAADRGVRENDVAGTRRDLGGDRVRDDDLGRVQRDDLGRNDARGTDIRRDDVTDSTADDRYTDPRR